jgi:hypothetical protein
MPDSAVGADKMSVRTPQADGIGGSVRDGLRNDNREAPAAPTMSGGVEPETDALPGAGPNRDVDGPRKAGMTPRPTDEPISPQDTTGTPVVPPEPGTP